MTTYIQTYSQTANDCMIRSLVQATGLSTPRVESMMIKDDYFWQQNMIYVIQQSGHDVELLVFELSNGKTAMHGFAMSQMYPKGTYILKMKGHVCTMIDGVIYDKTDTRFEGVYWSWRIINL